MSNAQFMNNMNYNTQQINNTLATANAMGQAGTNQLQQGINDTGRYAAAGAAALGNIGAAAAPGTYSPGNAGGLSSYSGTPMGGGGGGGQTYYQPTDLGPNYGYTPQQSYSPPTTSGTDYRYSDAGYNAPPAGTADWWWALNGPSAGGGGIQGVPTAADSQRLLGYVPDQSLTMQSAAPSYSPTQQNRPAAMDVQPAYNDYGNRGVNVGSGGGPSAMNPMGYTLADFPGWSSERFEQYFGPGSAGGGGGGGAVGGGSFYAPSVLSGPGGVTALPDLQLPQIIYDGGVSNGRSYNLPPPNVPATPNDVQGFNSSGGGWSGSGPIGGQGGNPMGYTLADFPGQTQEWFNRQFGGSSGGNLGGGGGGNRDAIAMAMLQQTPTPAPSYPDTWTQNRGAVPNMDMPVPYSPNITPFGSEFDRYTSSLRNPMGYTPADFPGWTADRFNQYFGSGGAFGDSGVRPTTDYGNRVDNTLGGDINTYGAAPGGHSVIGPQQDVFTAFPYTGNTAQAQIENRFGDPNTDFLTLQAQRELADTNRGLSIPIHNDYYGGGG
jgi:hypothetical protein